MNWSKERILRLPAWILLLGLGVLLEGGLVAFLLLVYRWPEPFFGVSYYYPGTRFFFAANWGISLPRSIDARLFHRLYSALWLILNGLWLAAFALARRCSRDLWIVFSCSLVFQCTMVLAMPPLLSTDIYNYLAYGRMVAFYGLNPYSMLPSQMGADPVLIHDLWDIVTPYGPLWTLLSAGVAWIAGRSGVFLGLLLLKAIAGLAHLAIAWLGFRLDGRNTGTVVLLAWSPLFLIEGAGNAHNDLTMMALALAGLLAFRRRMPWAGILLLFLSAMVKYISLLLLLFCVIAWFRETQGVWKRLRLLGSVALVCLLLLALFYSPFWQGPDTLLRNLREESARLRLTPLAYLRPFLRQLWSDLPPGQADARALLTIQLLQKGLLVLLVLWQGRQVWLSRRDLWHEVASAWGLTSLVYACFLHNTVQSWYFVWAFSAAAPELAHPESRRIAFLSGALGIVTSLFYTAL